MWPSSQRPRTVPLSYIARNLWVRRVTTSLTAGGMAMVVYVFATVLMMSEGIRATLVATGEPDNVLVLRKGAGAEIQSVISRDQVHVLETFAGMATDVQGRPLIAAEPVVLNNLAKREGGEMANVTVRGTRADIALTLRPQVHLVRGRMFRPGTSEVIAGRALIRGFANVDTGQSLEFAGRRWLVVGVFDAGHSGFDSEIWGDSEQMLQAYRRTTFSTVVFRLADIERLDAAIAQIGTDPRLGLEAKSERRFYAEQSELLTKFINYLGLFLSAIFSVGAIVGAMITMFAAVAQRTGEIGTLRALGFRRGAVLAAFLGESLGLSLAGGLLGLAGASAMQNVHLSTTNFQTFSEIAFSFRLTPLIAIETLGFALFMGMVGGFIPAWNAARMNIVECLRAA